jgi:hypothetical protein
VKDLERKAKMYRKDALPTYIYVAATKHGECRVGLSKNAEKRVEDIRCVNPTIVCAEIIPVQSRLMATRIKKHVLDRFDNKRVTRRGARGQTWVVAPKDEVVKQLKTETAVQTIQAMRFRDKYPHQFDGTK